MKRVHRIKISSLANNSHKMSSLIFFRKSILECCHFLNDYFRVKIFIGTHPSSTHLIFIMLKVEIGNKTEYTKRITETFTSVYT